MPELRFFDRRGSSASLAIDAGERLVDALLRNAIPPPSVIVTEDGVPIPETRRAAAAGRYEARMIEGYDLAAIRRLHETGDRHENPDAVYEKHRLVFGEGGEVFARRRSYGASEVRSYVERMLREVVTYYDLVAEDDRVILGLSGGMDSSALLLGLSEIREELPPFDLVAVTVEAPWESEDESIVENARAVADRAGVDHRVIPQETVDETFNVATSLSDVLEAMNETGPADHAGALFDSVVTRMLEAAAEEHDADSICLGAHATEAVAGLLNANVFGFDVESLPRKHFDDRSYVYPFSLLSKKEIAHYYRSHVGELPGGSPHDPWRLYPTDHSLYYYVADVLQHVWPGIQYWLVEGHHSTAETGRAELRDCRNCGKTKRVTDLPEDDSALCNVCTILSARGFLAD